MVTNLVYRNVMAIRDFFSKRQKRNNEEVPDVYIYNELPCTLKNKIHQIILGAAGRDRTEKFPQTATSIVFLIQAHKNFTQKNTSDV